MQQNPDRPTRKDIEEADESKKQLHIDSRFRTDANFQQGDVKRIEQGGEQRQPVPEKGEMPIPESRRRCRNGSRLQRRWWQRRATRV